jgi:hypothetical protein
MDKPHKIKDGQMDLKSPVFTPRPGWGGQLRSWLKKTFGLNPIQFWTIVLWLAVLIVWLKK